MQPGLPFSTELSNNHSADWISDHEGKLGELRKSLPEINLVCTSLSIVTVSKGRCSQDNQGRWAVCSLTWCAHHTIRYEKTAIQVMEPKNVIGKNFLEACETSRAGGVSVALCGTFWAVVEPQPTSWQEYQPRITFP